MPKTLNYDKMSVEDMKEYIENNCPNEKEWFKKVGFTEKLNKKGEMEKVYIGHFKVRKIFCEKFMPEIIPVAKPKEQKKSDILLNW